jgi:protein SCO1/2
MTRLRIIAPSSAVLTLCGVASVLGVLLEFVGTPRLRVRATGPAAEYRRIHNARGVVREIASDRRTALIQHDAITDYMPGMTMEFNLRDTNELKGVTVGDTIRFRLTTTEDTHWIDQVRLLAHATGDRPAEPPRLSPPEPAELAPGDLLPDGELLAETGHPVRFSDFRGKALAFTFMFTRCLMPDYCPRTENSFATARKLLEEENGSATNWQFLSVSFDADFDSAPVLSSYGNLYRAGDPDRWLFAAAPAQRLAELAPRIGLLVQKDSGGSISHNLRTIVLDPQGRLFRRFDGNSWTPRQLAEAMLHATRLATSSQPQERHATTNNHKSTPMKAPVARQELKGRNPGLLVSSAS